jgi:glycosyltransferase involved in cell wall biosynthesis
VERLAYRGVEVTLHSFEKGAPDEAVGRRLEAAGVRWQPHRFVSAGGLGGLIRVVEGAAFLARAQFVHARGDLPAAASLITRRPTWLWDMRALWREERIALGSLRPGSAEARVMQRVEAAAARRSAGIVTLSRAVIEVLRARYGEAVAAKCRVITTCVDLERFVPSPLPGTDPVRLLLAGTLNNLYDVDSMIRLFQRLRARRPSQFTVLTPDPSSWRDRFASIDAAVTSADAAAMPSQIAEHHVGLCMRRLDIGVSSRAVTPIKLGEFLACGRPVVVTPGLGDMDEFVEENDCGVVVDDLSDRGLDAAIDALESLLEDPGTPSRCRTVAEKHFNLDEAVDELLVAYRDALR